MAIRAVHLLDSVSAPLFRHIKNVCFLTHWLKVHILFYYHNLSNQIIISVFCGLL